MRLLIIIYILLLSACQVTSEDAEVLLVEKEVAAVEKKREFYDLVDTSCYVGNVVLDMESVAGLYVSEQEYTLVSDLINAASDGISPKEKYSRSEALEILIFIDNLIKERRKSGISYNASFAMCLRYGYYDCDINTLLFLSIAEAYKLPLKAVLMPGHMVVVWKDGVQTIYWETTEGKARSMGHYLKRFKTDTSTLKTKLLYKPLSRRQLLAVNFYNIGLSFAETDNFKPAVDYLRYASQLEEGWGRPYTALAYVYLEENLPDQAIYYANQGLKRSGEQYELYKVKGQALAAIGCNTEAVEEYEEYLQNLPKQVYDYQNKKKQLKEEMWQLEEGL